MEEKIVGIRLIMIMLGMLLTGTGNTILMKIQNLTEGAHEPTDRKNPQYWQHPFLQCAIMFFGELLCLGAYGIKLLSEKKKVGTKGYIEIETS